MNNSERFRRFQIEKEIESQCLGSIQERIDRYFEIEHQGVIGEHFFAPASSECIYLYRDGYFIGTVMMSHSINEGIIKFVAERNGIKKQNEKSLKEVIDELQTKGVISIKCANAAKAIWRSYRNDIHHMNPKVTEIPFQKLAQRNIKHLSTIEKEIFGHNFKDGAINVYQPKYWDFNSDGKINAVLRLRK